MPRPMKVLGFAWVLPLLAAGCNEPTYTDARGNVEVSPLDQNGMPTGVSKPTEEAVLPIYQLDTDMPDDFRVRREANRILAMMRATATGNVPEMVTLLLPNDLAIRVDWPLKNPEDIPTTANEVLHVASDHFKILRVITRRFFKRDPLRRITRHIEAVVVGLRVIIRRALWQTVICIHQR